MDPSGLSTQSDWSYWNLNEQSTSATPVGCPWTQRLDGHRCGSRRTSRDPNRRMRLFRTNDDESEDGTDILNFDKFPVPDELPSEEEGGGEEGGEEGSEEGGEEMSEDS